MNPAASKFALLSVLALACGCGESPCPPIVLDTTGVTPAVNYEPLAEVLADQLEPGVVILGHDLMLYDVQPHDSP